MFYAKICNFKAPFFFLVPYLASCDVLMVGQYHLPMQ